MKKKLIIDKDSVREIADFAIQVFNKRLPAGIKHGTEVQAYLFLSAFHLYLHKMGIEPQFEVDYEVKAKKHF